MCIKSFARQTRAYKRDTRPGRSNVWRQPDSRKIGDTDLDYATENSRRWSSLPKEGNEKFGATARGLSHEIHDKV